MTTVFFCRCTKVNAPIKSVETIATIRKNICLKSQSHPKLWMALCPNDGANSFLSHLSARSAGIKDTGIRWLAQTFYLGRAVESC